MATSGLVMFGIDHDPISRLMLESMFAADYAVELFPSAEACLARLQETRPDLMLLDVELPGMDGFELCRRLKDDPATAAVPVIFISAADSLESRLRGYDSGGEDFILKPYAIEEVKRRVATVRGAIEGAASLRRQMEDSELLSSLLLANMDEYAVLIKFMRGLNECADEEGIAEAILAALGGFGLDGVVQIRQGSAAFTLSREGRDRPLEVSVLDHVRRQGRIFEFRQRCVFNFDGLTILAKNMPTTDPEACGRLRDHLAIVGEMADGKLQALLATRRNLLTEGGIRELLGEIRGAIDAYIHRHQTARQQEVLRTSELLDQMALALARLGMTHEQEDEIEQLVVDKARTLISLYDTGEESTATLRALGDKLEKILA